VKTAGTDGDRVEVTEGLAPGERVVLSPPPTLKPGDKVTGK
jgi:multidrug efflux pump subunit AcrA (membrane-fusion protein)